MTATRPLTMQAWAVWGAAASMPFLLGRNPFPMLVAVLAVIAVRWSHPPLNQHAFGWRILIRAAVLVSLIAIIFNVLTVRTGEQVIVRIPDGWPLIAGPVTWNAVVYGVLAAIGVLGLVLVWATVGGVVQWASLARLLPDPFIGIAVAGSTAINLVPQTAAALTDIREATAARGYAPTGVRGVATVLTPMINVGLDRSMRLAEVLEARGFGSRRQETAKPPAFHDLAWTAMLGGVFIAGYGLIAAITWAAIGGMAAALVGGLMIARQRTPNAVRRTQYRQEPLRRADWIVIGTSIAVAALCIFARELDQRIFVYEPYPDIDVPNATLWPLLALFGLFVPLLFAPAKAASDD
jgi:energy-coupling factor transport system permease protein